MLRKSMGFLAMAILVFTSAAPAADWVAGKHYTVLSQPQRTTVATGKVEVMEVFSYGCPACNSFQPVVKKLKAELPANAQLVYLPASWHPQENWHVFQRAYLAARSLGVADKVHDAFFDAVWTTGELAIMDPAGRLKGRLPTIEEVGQFYQRAAGVKAADFLAAAKSFGVEGKMKQADNQIKTMQVGSTPTFVVNGKYRINNDKLGSSSELIELVKFLVAKESSPAAKKP